MLVLRWIFATEELSAHTHNIVASATNLSGWFPGASGTAGGVFSMNPIPLRGYLRLDSNYTDCSNITLNAAITPMATIQQSGGDIAHENRPPYEIVYRWKRTA